ncbi:hypothetical protein AB0I35_32135 [Nocardia sp. NPDC050378]|uniref:hypothetical protein n=1 Tax=Nocardia sp. NPDC050378 TaxID=3155400 RepID=UPI003400B99E
MSSALDEWSYGDSVYGLEPLVLPEPGSLPVYTEAADESAHLTTKRGNHHRLTISPVTTEDLERLFWFRWITGHHISFILWQLIANRMAGVAEGDRSGPSIARWVRGYSASLLYTSSCTREIYNSLIRPSMYRVHPGFSGTWAPDYVPLRGLFRRGKLPPVAPNEQEQLLREIGLANQVHIGVASRLVPNGRSLLQNVAAAGSLSRQPQTWATFFDCYFITLRAQVPVQQVLTQLVRRCRAVVVDINANGLYPAAACYPEEFPDELRSTPVQALQKELFEIMVDIAGSAASHPSAQSAGRRT